MKEDQRIAANTTFAIPAPDKEDFTWDDVIYDVPQEDQGVVSEYEVVDNGTSRGKKKLVDKRGYQYSIKVRKSWLY